MSYQACVIFQQAPPMWLRGAHPLGVQQHLLDFMSIEARKKFVESDAVWWYCYPEDLDWTSSGGVIGRPRQQNVGVTSTAGRWNKGGAWAALEGIKPAEDMNRDDVW